MTLCLDSPEGIQGGTQEEIATLEGGPAVRTPAGTEMFQGDAFSTRLGGP